MPLKCEGNAVAVLDTYHERAYVGSSRFKMSKVHT